MPSLAQAPFQVIIKAVPSIRVLALRQIIANYQSQGPLWARVLQFAHFQGIPRRTGADAAGLAVFYDPSFKASDVDTEVCLPIAAHAKLPLADLKEFQVYDMAELPRAASVTHVGSYAGLKATYGQLFGWFAANGETVNGPIREIYHVGIDSTDGDDDKLVTEIVVPLA